MRRRLIALYAKALPLPAALVDELAARTEDASPAFIKELSRRVAQHHLQHDTRGAVARSAAEAALHEMLFSGGAPNARRLGGHVSESA